MYTIFKKPTTNSSSISISTESKIACSTSSHCYIFELGNTQADTIALKTHESSFCSNPITTFKYEPTIDPMNLSTAYLTEETFKSHCWFKSFLLLTTSHDRALIYTLGKGTFSRDWDLVCDVGLELQNLGFLEQAPRIKCASWCQGMIKVF